MASNDFLSPLTRLDPGQFISRYEEWIIFTLLIFFFWAIIGIALRKKFEQSTHLRVLTTTLSIMIAVSVYYSIYKGWLHFSLQSFGVFGVILICIIIFFIVFGLMRGYNVKTYNALPMGYTLFYISIWAVSPNIFHTIAEKFALVNTALFILFLVSVAKIIVAFFHHTRDPNQAAKDLFRNKMHQRDEPQIDKEIEFEEKERKLIKTRTLKITKQELSSLDKIKHFLKDIAQILGDSGNLTDLQKNHIAESLQRIAHIRQQFINGLNIIEKHIQNYKDGDQQKIIELKKRYHATKDSQKRKRIQKEHLYERKKLDIYDFWNNHKGKIHNLLTQFNSHIDIAVRFMQQNQPKEAINPIKSGLQILNTLHDVLAKLRGYEKYILKISRKEQAVQEKEKEGR